MKIFTTVIFSIALSLHMKSQLTPEWQVNTGMAPNGRYAAIVLDNNEDVIISRFNTPTNTFFYGHSIAKYDADGNQLWMLDDGDASDNYNFGMNDLTIGSDNSIILVGGEMSSEDPTRFSTAVKISSNGEQLWSMIASDMPWTTGDLMSVAVHDNGDIYASGELYNADINDIAPAIVKISSEGNLQWTRFDDVNGYGVIEIHNGMLYVLNQQTVQRFDLDGIPIDEQALDYGTSGYLHIPVVPRPMQYHGNEVRVISHTMPAEENQQVGVMSCNADGDFMWEVLVDVYDGDTQEQVIPTGFEMMEDGSVLISGSFNQPNSGEDFRSGSEEFYNGIFAARISAGGDIIWQSSFLSEGDDDGLYAVSSVLTDVGQYLVVCATYTVSFSSQVVKSFDVEDGGLLWTDIETGTDYFDQLSPNVSVISSDGFIYTSGTGVHMTKGELHILYLNKYQPLTVGISDVVAAGIISAYPNPFKDEFYITGIKGYYTMTLYDASGRICHSESLGSANTITVSLPDLQKGVYTAIFNGEHSTFTTMIVKQ